MVGKMFAVLALVALGVYVAGCSEEPGGVKLANQPPTVWLSSGPPEGSTTQYIIHFFWGGWDPDGEILFYEYAITDNVEGVFDPADTTGVDKWHRVYSNDSTFVFSADQLADSSTTSMVADFQRSHTFFVRSVDREGLRSVRPAHRSFTSRTLSPEIKVEIPRTAGVTPALVPPISTFRWTATDYIGNLREIQDPDSVRWILLSSSRFGGDRNKALEYVRKNPKAPEWSKWRYYRAPQDSGKFWTTSQLAFGDYIFAAQAKDEAGAVTPVFDWVSNARWIRVTQRRTGPLLTVTNQFIGSILSSTAETPLTIVDLPAAIPIVFTWTASAEEYGGVVSGYRYGWDILDVNDDSQWETGFTPFVGSTASSPSRKFFFGIHTFFIEVIDNSGFKSRVGVRINIVPFTMQKNLLFVDDYDEQSPLGIVGSNGASPNDREHDAFWRSVIEGVGVKGFDWDVDVIEINPSSVFPLQTVASYRSIIWNTYGGYGIRTPLSFLANVIRFVPQDPNLSTATGKVTPNILALYLAAGGHFLLCGEQPLTMVINKNYFPRATKFPFIFRYELLGDQDGQYEKQDVGKKGVGEASFGYYDCCVSILDVAYTDPQSIRRAQTRDGCPVDAIRRFDPVNNGLRYCIPQDKKHNFPQLNLRPEVAGTGRFYAPESRGLQNEIYNPPFFQNVCPNFAELSPMRPCFEPIYGHGCLNQNSAIFRGPVAFWTLRFADKVPDVPGGKAARSAVWGFEPFFFNPDEVKEALKIVLLDEWGLEPAVPPVQ